MNHYDQFSKIQRKLFRYSLSLTGNRSDAEDISQETLINIWSQRDNWYEWKNFEAYSMRMLRNTFLNHKKKHSRVSFIDINGFTETPGQNDIEAQITLSDLRMKFHDLISKLPEIQRNILHLREIEEMEYKEIAEILDLSESQVKVYLFRGRQHIKNKMKFHGIK